MTVDQVAMDGLMDEVTKWGHAYGAAFSSKSPDQVLSFYKPHSRITMHQLDGDRTGKGGAGKDITVFTGSVIAALVRRLLPAHLMLRIVFRRLAKRGYDHSVLLVHGVKPALPPSDPSNVEVLLTFERRDRDGKTFESAAVVYRLERTETTWLITEAWLFDSLESPPPLARRILEG